MNITTEPTAPTMKAAVHSIVKIKFRASVKGLWIRFCSAREVAGFCAKVSKIIFWMMKRTKPRTDTNSIKVNFLPVLQGWANARTKAVAANNARSMPGRLSFIPTTIEAIVSKAEITRSTSVLFLLREIEKASIISISFLIMDLVNDCSKVYIINGLRG